MKKLFPRLVAAVVFASTPAASFAGFVLPDSTIRQGEGGVLGTSAGGDKFGVAMASGDFNDDGYEDLAIGAQGETNSRGAVNVIYGTPAGLNPVPLQQWFGQIASQVEDGALFGSALAVGDFNSDGFADLAVGAQRRDVGGATNAGAVTVFYGSALGLDLISPDFWTQDNTFLRSPLSNDAEANDLFGQALVAGDFDGDTIDDLAIGVPGQKAPAVSGTAHGAFQIMFGDPLGLVSTNGQLFHQNNVQNGIARDGERFAESLAAGYFDADQYADLAVGCQYDTFPNSPTGDRAGSVTIFFGTSTGITASGAQLWYQDLGALPGVSDPGDEFGHALVVGSFDGDSFDDLAIGVPGKAVGASDAAGEIVVLYGGPDKEDVGADNEFLRQGLDGVLDGAEAQDRFGYALAASRRDGDDLDFLVVGAAYEGLPPNLTGTVHIIHPSASGLKAAASNDYFNQETPDFSDAAELGDHFGAALAVGDFDGDGQFDLAIAVPDEDFTGQVDSGYVHVLYQASPAVPLFEHDFECGCYGGFIPVEEPPKSANDRQ
jgi:hypothetical protein